MSAGHEARLRLAESDNEAAGRLADEARLRRDSAMAVLAEHRWNGTRPSLAEYEAWSEAHVEFSELNALYKQPSCSTAQQPGEDIASTLLYAM